MNLFFGYSVVEKLKLIRFNDEINIVPKALKISIENTTKL